MFSQKLTLIALVQLHVLVHPCMKTIMSLKSCGTSHPCTSSYTSNFVGFIGLILNMHEIGSFRKPLAPQVFHPHFSCRLPVTRVHTLPVPATITTFHHKIHLHTTFHLYQPTITTGSLVQTGKIIFSQ